MDFFFDRQKVFLDELGSITENTEKQKKLFGLNIEIIKAQQVWDFFRDKLELRFNPFFKDSLNIADTVAWDCYRSTLNKAEELGIISQDRFREPPLTYLIADFSPATYVRGIRPMKDNEYLLERFKLPIPLIEIPWDHLTNLWEFLSIHHEVGHDLEMDLGLLKPLEESLSKLLKDKEIPEPRRKMWLLWLSETFADLVALLLAGSAFTSSMINVLTLPQDKVVIYVPDIPHPTPYIRIFINTAFIRRLIPGNDNLNADADNLEKAWKELYGNVQTIGEHNVEDIKSDFEFVFEALMDTKFDILKSHTVRDLIPFSGQIDATIRAASQYLVTGQNHPTSILPRHVISAARMAVTSIFNQSAVDNEAALKSLTERTLELVKSNTPPGLKDANDNNTHKNFVRSLTNDLDKSLQVWNEANGSIR